MQENRSTPLSDRLIALTIALTLPLLSLIWLLEVQPAPIAPRTSVEGGETLQVTWVRSGIGRTIVPVPEMTPPDSMEMPAKAPEQAMRNRSEASDEFIAQSPSDEDASVNLPGDPTGTVYDPSKLEAVATSAASRLINAPLSDDSARLDPLSLIDHPPVLRFPLVPQQDTTATVEFTIGASGNALNTALFRSSGDPELDAAILASAHTWRFDPERRNGEGVASRLQVEVSLLGDPAPEVNAMLPEAPASPDPVLHAGS